MFLPFNCRAGLQGLPGLLCCNQINHPFRLLNTYHRRKQTNLLMIQNLPTKQTSDSVLSTFLPGAPGGVSLPKTAIVGVDTLGT